MPTFGNSSTRFHGNNLRTILQKRVNDGAILRLIGMWLHVGVLEAGQVVTSEEGHSARGTDLARSWRTSSCTRCWMNGSKRKSDRGWAGTVFWCGLRMIS